MVESSLPIAMDLEIHDLLNQIRANPQMLVSNFTSMLSNFEGKVLKRPGHSVNLMTNEGATAVQEAIDFLKKQAPLKNPLIWNNEIWKASRDHVFDTGPKSLTGHTGTDGN